MATSIDKSTNWRNAAAAPDYQVAARRVDTMVQTPTNTKGDQIAAALNQASGVVSSVGKQQLQKKRELQVAELETTTAKIQQELSDGTIARITDSNDYQVLPEVLRIRVAQSIGKTDGDAQYNEMLSAYEADPNTALTDESLEAFLGQYQVEVDGLDGYNIHRQASQLEALNANKTKLRGDALSKRSAYNKTLLTDTLTKEVTAVFGDTTLTAEEKWNKISELDAETTGLVNTDKNVVYFETAKLIAETTGNTDILQDHNIKNTAFKNPLFNIVNQQVSYKMQQRANAQTSFDQSQNEYQRKEDVREEKMAYLASIQSGTPIDMSAISSPEVENWVMGMLNRGVVPDTVSSTNRSNLESFITDSILAGKELKIGEKVYPNNTQGINAYIVDKGGLNPTDIEALQKKAGDWADTGNIENIQVYKNLFGTNSPIPKILTNTYSMLEGDADVWQAETTLQLKRELMQLYSERKADGSFGMQDTIDVEKIMVERAKMLAERVGGASQSGDDVDTLLSGFKFNDGDGSSEKTPDVVVPEDSDAKLIKNLTTGLQVKNNPSVTSNKNSKTAKEAATELKDLAPEVREAAINDYAENAIEKLQAKIPTLDYTFRADARELLQRIRENPEVAFEDNKYKRYYD